MLLPVELGETGQAIEIEIRALGVKLLDLVSERGEIRAVDAGTEVEVGELSGTTIFLRDGYLQEVRGDSGQPLYTYSPGDVITASRTSREGEVVHLESDFAAEVVVFEGHTLADALREVEGALELWIELGRVQREMLEHVCVKLGAALERPRLRFARYEAGDVIIEEGADADSVYELMNGEASVCVGEQELGVVGSGQIFGEMSFLLDQPRAATVRAKTVCDVQITVRDDFLSMIQSKPSLLANIARGLAARVTELDEKILKA